jgi:hypothetical protein
LKLKKKDKRVLSLKEKEKKRGKKPTASKNPPTIRRHTSRKRT